MIRTGHLKYKFVRNNKITRKYYYPIFKVDIANNSYNVPSMIYDTTEGWIWHTTSNLQNVFNTVYNNYKNLAGFSIKWLSTAGSDSNDGSYANPVLTLDRVKALTGTNPTLVLIKDTSDNYVYTYSSSGNVTKDFSNIVFFGGKFNSSLQCTSIVRPTIKLQLSSSNLTFTLNFKEIHNIKIIKSDGNMVINTTSTNEQYFNTIFQDIFATQSRTDTVSIPNPRWCYFHLARTTSEPNSFNEYIYTGSRYAYVSFYTSYYGDIYDLNGNLICSVTNDNYYTLRDTIMNYLLSTETMAKDVFVVFNLTTGSWGVINAEIENRIILRRIGLINDFVNEYVVTLKPNFYNDYPQFLNGYWLVDRNEDYNNFLNKEVASITADDLSGLSENFLLLVQHIYDNTSYDITLVFNQNVYNTVWSINDVIGNAWQWKIVSVFQVWQLSESVSFKKYADNSYEGTLIFRNYDNEIVDKSKPLIL